MMEQGIDRFGAEYKRTSNDFRFKALPYDNHVCSVCHGTGAKIEFEYVKRDYESARRKGKICKTLQAHERSVWICPVCVKNMMEKWTRFYRQQDSTVVLALKGGEENEISGGNVY